MIQWAVSLTKFSYQVCLLYKKYKNIWIYTEEMTKLLTRSSTIIEILDTCFFLDLRTGGENTNLEAKSVSTPLNWTGVTVFSPKSRNHKLTLEIKHLRHTTSTTILHPAVYHVNQLQGSIFSRPRICSMEQKKIKPWTL